jgi:hypothetical protein
MAATQPMNDGNGFRRHSLHTEGNPDRYVNLRGSTEHIKGPTRAERSFAAMPVLVLTALSGLAKLSGRSKEWHKFGIICCAV